MPYVISKVKGGFKVRKEGTREYYSNRPLTRTVAEAQRRALYASENRKRKK